MPGPKAGENVSSARGLSPMAPPRRLEYQKHLPWECGLLASVSSGTHPTVKSLDKPPLFSEKMVGSRDLANFGPTDQASVVCSEVVPWRGGRAQHNGGGSASDLKSLGRLGCGWHSLSSQDGCWRHLAAALDGQALPSFACWPGSPREEAPSLSSGQCGQTGMAPWILEPRPTLF